MFWKRRGGWGWGFDRFGLGQVWWVTICVTNRALPYSMSNDILRIVLCRGLVKRVCLFQRKVWENLWQTFSRPSKLLILEGTFDISEVFAVLLGRVLVTILLFLFSKHSCSVHFLFNEFSDDIRLLNAGVQMVCPRGLKSENESLIFGIRKWAFDCVCLLSSCSS